ncbi:hypothetical protein ABEB36_007747 [Hypothenemus hampei]|uniref:TAFII55 protein conserved region domain-containing protein n=1 Tax=Hypothenemus hampei TaxID=57062 RepID=A0ABD1EV07_HYPHA
MKFEKMLRAQSDEIEEQFILRLPIVESEKIRGLLRDKPEKLKRTLKIDLDPLKCEGTVIVGRKSLPAYLKKFPTIIESYKTNIANDKTNLYKTADISYILECFEHPVKKVKKEFIHGYTPPLKNVKKNRFRKTLVNPEETETTEMITKELYYLLSTDLDAVTTRFEILYENDNDENRPNNLQTEMHLFGQFLSSDSDVEIDIVD